MNADFDLIVPIAFDRNKQHLAGFGFQGIARLKPGVTIAQANADVARMLPIWMDSWPNGRATIRTFMRSLENHAGHSPSQAGSDRQCRQRAVGGDGDHRRGDADRLHQCGEPVAGEGGGRQQELAVRAALGAGRGRIARELLVESVPLGLMGGVLGIGLAYEGLRLLVAIGPANLPRLGEISLDARSLGFTLALSLLSGLLFGSIPALRYAGRRIATAFRRRRANGEREPGTASLAQSAGGGAGGDGAGAAGERQADDSHLPGIADCRARDSRTRSICRPCASLFRLP